MARRRLYGETQKRRKKISTAKLKRHGSPQRIEATQIPAPFERSATLERPDLEFLEAMRELGVVPHRRRAVSAERLAQAESMRLAENGDQEFIAAMARLGVRPLAAGRNRASDRTSAGSPSNRVHGRSGATGRTSRAALGPAVPATPIKSQHPNSPPAPASLGNPEAQEVVLDVARAENAAHPDPVTSPATPGTTDPARPEATTFETGGLTMEEALRHHFNPAPKYKGAPSRSGPRRAGPRRVIPDSAIASSIDDEIDLHGKTEEEAIRAVQNFMQTAHRRRYRSVLIITGKGRNSGPQGPILRDAVHGWLERNGEQFAREFRWAPRHLGGTGAIWVALRQSSR